MKIFNTKSELEALENLGLSDKEALIYLSALELGGGTVSEIAENAEIERSGIYYHIDKLLRDDLLRTATRGKRTVYLAADPENLKAILKHKEKDLFKVLPKMQEQFARETGRSIVEYYQGEEEVGKFYNRVYEIFRGIASSNSHPELDSGSIKKDSGSQATVRNDNNDNVIYVLGNSFKAVSSKSPVFRRFITPADQINVHLKTILPMSQKSKEPDGNAGDPYIVTRYNLPRSEIRFIGDKYAYLGSVVITKNHIVFYDFRNFFYSITENSNLALTWRMFFEFIWDRL